MNMLNNEENFWSINYYEKDPAAFNAQIAGAMRIAEKIVRDPELYLSERAELLKIISSVKHASLIKTVEEVGVGHCEEFPFDEFNILRDDELNDIIISQTPRQR